MTKWPLRVGLHARTLHGPIFQSCKNNACRRRSNRLRVKVEILFTGVLLLVYYYTRVDLHPDIHTHWLYISYESTFKIIDE